MQLTSALYRNTILFFATFYALVLWGFWNRYYSNPLQVSNLLVQLHGFAMTLWCVMLIAQAYLIRTSRRALHRLIGKTSYVLAPLNVVLQIAVIRSTVPAHPELFDKGMISAPGFVFLSLSIVGASVFAVLYGLAIFFRRTPALHARYMACTALPILAAATDRIVFFYFAKTAERLPKVAGTPYAPFVAWAMADLTLMTLVVWDWTSHRRLNVFPLVLLALLAYQVFTVNAHQVSLWRTFCQWFLGYPLV